MNQEIMVANYRRQYRTVRQALPWLDASFWPEDAPRFERYAVPLAHATAPAIVVRPDSAGTIRRSRVETGICLWRWLPLESGPLSALEPVIAELSACHGPLVVRQTDLTFAELEALAGAHPQLAVILESGPRKLLYHLAPLEAALLKYPNLWLSTYNFCNWLGLERLCSKGLLARLLFGTHAPRFSPDVAMGPIVMSHFSWEEKCALAGNNLRRLLRLPLQHPPARNWECGAPFIIDAHSHNLLPGSLRKLRFPTPDQDYAPADWVARMDEVGIEQMFLIPSDALYYKTLSPRELAAPMLRQAPDRFRYMTVFHPAMNEAERSRVAAELRDPACVAVKIHPASHEVDAGDPSFDAVYRLAVAAGKPVVTHSWEISDYNPVQHLTHPDRFRSHLAAHPQVTLVLGHAGGRPSTLEAVAGICRDFPRTMVDVSGDYFDNGLIDCLADRLGVQRVMFGSDTNWIDPRSNLGPVVASRLADDAVLQILRDNARRLYLRETS